MLKNKHNKLPGRKASGMASTWSKIVTTVTKATGRPQATVEYRENFLHWEPVVNLNCVVAILRVLHTSNAIIIIQKKEDM